jgi:hypothetical protein
MPIIVDEVVISVEVGTKASGGKTSSTPSPTDEKKAIVAECVERVLDILSQKKER